MEESDALFASLRPEERAQALADDVARLEQELAELRQGTLTSIDEGVAALRGQTEKLRKLLRTIEVRVRRGRAGGCRSQPARAPLALAPCLPCAAESRATSGEAYGAVRAAAVPHRA